MQGRDLLRANRTPPGSPGPDIKTAITSAQ